MNDCAPKPDILRSKRYLEHVREYSCIFCCSPHNIVAHHIRTQTDGGMGLKPSDCYVVPLCPECHSKVHSGEETIGHIEAIFEMNSMLMDYIVEYANNISAVDYEDIKSLARVIFEMCG